MGRGWDTVGPGADERGPGGRRAIFRRSSVHADSTIINLSDGYGLERLPFWFDSVRRTYTMWVHMHARDDAFADASRVDY